MNTESTREQIQEDIISWFASELPDKRLFVSNQSGSGESVFEIDKEEMIDELCQIVVDNFAKLEGNNN